MGKYVCLGFWARKRINRCELGSAFLHLFFGVEDGVYEKLVLRLGRGRFFFSFTFGFVVFVAVGDIWMNHLIWVYT